MQADPDLKKTNPEPSSPQCQDLRPVTGVKVGGSVWKSLVWSQVKMDPSMAQLLWFHNCRTLRNSRRSEKDPV